MTEGKESGPDTPGSRSRKWLWLAIVLALGLRLTHLSAIAVTTIPKWQDVNDETDFAATWKWATGIAQGDVLGRTPYHPYTGLMAMLGTQADWARWEGDQHVFHQSPLYAYVVAWLAHPPEGNPLWLFLFQALMGTACVPLVFFLAKSWAGERAGLFAAFLWAAARLEIVLDSLLLRDSLVLPLLLVGVCCLEALRACLPGQARRAALLSVGAGFSLGLATLERENGFLMVLAAIPMAAWLCGRGGRRVMTAALVLLSAAIAFSPLVIRNVRLGVRPLALSCRGPQEMLMGLTVYETATPIRYVFSRQLRDEMEASHHSTVTALGIALANASHAKARFLRNMAWKSWAWVSAAEPGDNVDLAYLMLRSPVLHLTLPMPPLLALAFVGIFAGVRQKKKLAVGWMCLLLLSLPLLVVFVVWRFKAIMLVWAVPFAGMGLAALVEEARAHRWGELFVPLGFALVFLVCAFVWPAGPVNQLRTLNHSMAAAVYEREGYLENARGELDEYLRLVQEGRASSSPALVGERDRLNRRIAALRPAANSAP